MFKNIGNLTQIAGLLKNLGQMKSKVAEAKQKLAGKTVVGSIPGDSVRIEMNGLGEVTLVAVDPAMLTPDFQAQLQASLQEATNKAIKLAKQLHVESIRELTGGVELPGMEGILEELAS